MFTKLFDINFSILTLIVSSLGAGHWRATFWAFLSITGYTKLMRLSMSTVRTTALTIWSTAQASSSNSTHTLAIAIWSCSIASWHIVTSHPFFQQTSQYSLLLFQTTVSQSCPFLVLLRQYHRSQRYVGQEG